MNNDASYDSLYIIIEVNYMATVTLHSFGYSSSVPPKTDNHMILSVKHFPAPPKNLRQMNGTHQQFYDGYWNEATDDLYQSLLRDIETNFTRKITDIYIGCHQGCHRSVACVERLKRDLTLPNIDKMEVVHDDLIIKNGKIVRSKNRSKDRDRKRENQWFSEHN